MVRDRIVIKYSTIIRILSFVRDGIERFGKMLKNAVLLLAIQITYWKPTLGGPTIVPADPFSAEDCAKNIHDYVEGPGTSDNEISDLLCRKPYTQRALIVEAYEDEFDGELVERLDDDVSGDQMKLYARLLEPPGAVLGNDLHHYIEKGKEGRVVELLCGSDNFDKRAIAMHYAEVFKIDVLADAANCNKDNQAFHKVLAEHCWRLYNETSVMTYATQAQEVAAYLHALSPSKDKANFILALESVLQYYAIPDLRVIFEIYRKLCNRGIDEAICEAVEGDVAKAYVTIVQVMENRYLYYANKLYEAVDGATTDERTIMRILVCQAEKDLGDILDAYKNKNGRTFENRLSSWLDGDATFTRKFLNALRYIMGYTD